MLQVKTIISLLQRDVEGHNKQGSRVNPSRWMVSSLLAQGCARQWLPVPRGKCSKSEVASWAHGCCTGWPLSLLVAPGISVMVMSWCPLEACGGLVCFSLKADFSGSAAAEAGSSKSLVRALLCLEQRLHCAGAQHRAQSSGCFQPIYFCSYLCKSGIAPKNNDIF